MEEEYFDYEEEEGELDQKSKCRLCGVEEKSKFLINIFGKSGRKYALDIKIRKCLPIVIREDDGMPKGVCLSCVNKLDVSWELVESSLRAHRNFLSVLTYDPIRARAEVMAEREEEEEEESADDQTEIGADDMSDSVSTEQPDNYNELPVVIKEEPMDVEDMESITLDPEEADGSAPENALDNVIVSSVKSIPKSSTQQSTDSLSMRLIQSLKESALRRQTGGITIKEEPLGSPPHSLILDESEAEKLNELQETPQVSQPATPTLITPDPL